MFGRGLWHPAVLAIGGHAPIRWLLVVALLAAACSPVVLDPSSEAGDQDEAGEPVEADEADEVDEVEEVPADDGDDGEVETLEDAEPSDPGSDDDPRREVVDIETPVRAVWVHLFDDDLKSAEGVEQVVEDLVDAEATLVIAQVVRRHDAYYSSEVLPATEDPQLEEGFDVLEALVPLAQEHDIEVHAWVPFAPTWHEVYDDLDAPQGWLPDEHGLEAPEEERWVTRTADGSWDDQLDPALPQAREHLSRIVVEIAETTEVDGIYLDQVRYASAEHGYHPEAIERFQAEAETSAVPEPDDEEFRRWRRAQTREVVADVDRALAEVERPVAFSVGVSSWGPGPAGIEGGYEATLPSTEAFQGWPDWAADGSVDLILPMNYFREHVGEQQQWYREWLEFEAELATAMDTLIVPGVGGWLNDRDDLVTQVGAATDAADGAGIFSYQLPSEGGSSGVWEQLADEAWGGG